MGNQGRGHKPLVIVPNTLVPGFAIAGFFELEPGKRATEISLIKGDNLSRALRGP
jgi:hypothetical protein